MTEPQPIGLDLTAAVVALVDGAPAILTVPGGAIRPETGKREIALPSGPFTPIRHRTLELGLRGFVEEQTGFTLGYIEQLYTFADRGRHATAPSSAPHFMSIGYLALTRPPKPPEDGIYAPAWRWRNWYTLFPWEDWRTGRPDILDSEVLPALKAWLRDPSVSEPPGRTLSRSERVALAFGENGTSWDAERVLERYELIYEAGLVGEAKRDGRAMSPRSMTELGQAMALDHRRIVATSIARLRGKMKYRPVVFELMPDDFTLTDLQSAVEAIAGHQLHKQNFRRLIERAGLVEPTGAQRQTTGGRPAALYRFRREVVAQRPSAGVRIGQPVVR